MLLDAQTKGLDREVSSQSVTKWIEAPEVNSEVGQKVSKAVFCFEKVLHRNQNQSSSASYIAVISHCSLPWCKLRRRDKDVQNAMEQQTDLVGSSCRGLAVGDEEQVFGFGGNSPF